MTSLCSSGCFWSFDMSGVGSLSCCNSFIVCSCSPRVVFRVATSDLFLLFSSFKASNCCWSCAKSDSYFYCALLSCPISWVWVSLSCWRDCSYLVSLPLMMLAFNYSFSSRALWCSSSNWLMCSLCSRRSFSIAFSCLSSSFATGISGLFSTISVFLDPASDLIFCAS